VLTCLSRRAPYLAVIVYPVPVQGSGAGQRIAAMLAKVSRRAEVDVVLLVRGGGSIEDLWAFNEEVVARAIRASALPIVVGVGHESDITIADFAADLRAPTPTAAAEVVAPARDALLADIRGRVVPLRRCLVHHLHRASQRLDYAQRSLATPRAPLAALDARVAALRARLLSAATHAIGRRRLVLGRQREVLLRLRVAAGRGAPREAVARLAALLAQRRHAVALRLGSLAARLGALDPHAVLERGYAIALTAGGQVVTEASALRPGDALSLTFARGGAEVRVQSLLAEGSRDLDEPRAERPRPER
jgi:exodeoxyribonuclease VII large subunit